MRRSILQNGGSAVSSSTWMRQEVSFLCKRDLTVFFHVLVHLWGLRKVCCPSGHFFGLILTRDEAKTGNLSISGGPPAVTCSWAGGRRCGFASCLRVKRDEAGAATPISDIYHIIYLYRYTSLPFAVWLRLPQYDRFLSSSFTLKDVTLGGRPCVNKAPKKSKMKTRTFFSLCDWWWLVMIGYDWSVPLRQWTMNIERWWIDEEAESNHRS